MKIVDREQERLEYEQTDEAKRKKIIHNVLYAIGIVILLTAAYFYYH